LEYQIGSAQVELQSLERLYDATVLKIKRARESQYELLQHVWPYAVRQSCPAPEMARRPSVMDHNIEKRGMSAEEFSI
jgi:hypothetical protein